MGNVPMFESLAVLALRKRTTLTLCSTESLTCAPRRNRSSLPPGLCVGHFPDNYWVDHRISSRKRVERSQSLSSRPTRRLYEGSSAASKAGGGLRSDGDSGQSRLGVLQKHS